MTTDPTPATDRPPLDLDAIRADLEYASSGIDGADMPYHPWALHAMRAAEKLLTEVTALRADNAVMAEALDAATKAAKSYRDAARAERTEPATGCWHCNGTGWDETRHFADQPAEAHPCGYCGGSGSTAPVTGEEEEVRTIAMVLLRQYDAQYDASHLTWEHFLPEATQIAAALDVPALRAAARAERPEPATGADVEKPYAALVDAYLAGAERVLDRTDPTIDGLADTARRLTEGRDALAAHAVPAATGNWHDFAEMGHTFYEFLSDQVTDRRLTTRGGDLRYGSPEFYAYLVERLVRRHHLISNAEYTSGLQNAARRADEAIAETNERRKAHIADGVAIRHRLATWLRNAADNPARVKSRYRAEGVRMAADWIDGGDEVV